MPDAIAAHLTMRVTRALSGHEGYGRPVIVRSEVDDSDHADCEAGEGIQANAFTTGMRCYRISLRLGRYPIT
jgi:hypothetical protein